ncbi:hypothetical protein ACK8P5_16540 [Paenibacillus sp. EC2-1]|uniref:hypothetical protein n=1 Tax=Paenibacillus sp. EC2-1 TaxID=3388665 RepID=UPI003BEEF9A2
MSSVHDFKSNKKTIARIFEKYRLYKFLCLGSDDPSKSEEFIQYCEHIENLVSQLPGREKVVIEERYMTVEHDYITDQTVYSEKMDPPVSPLTFAKIRDSACSKILNIILQ